MDRTNYPCAVVQWCGVSFLTFAVGVLAPQPLHALHLVGKEIPAHSRAEVEGERSWDRDRDRDREKEIGIEN